ncbi:MAG: hypothetical protein EBZ95_04860 [Chitinophagia bacterium]|nr:hypothetical protein [Chitinophagia bacterium]
MIKNYMTSDDLIRSVKLRAFLPTNQATFTDEDLLMFANEEMSIGLVPSIMRLHEDYFLYVQETTIGSSLSYGCTFQDSGNLVVLADHGFGGGEVVIFSSVVDTTGITANTGYYVVNPTLNTFQLATILGGTPINLVNNGTGVIFITRSNSRFQIPYRAVGSKLRDVSLKDDTGNFFEMTRINIGEIPFYNGGAHGVRPYAFYIENNSVVLAPERVSFVYGAVIRMTYYMRPNNLVLLNQVASITNIDRTTGQITVSNLPSDFAIDHVYDLVSVRSPNKTLAFDIGAISIDPISKIFTFDSGDIPTFLNVGDHICLAGTSAIPQIPSDLHVILAQRVAARCLEALGDTEGLQNANAKLAEMTTLSEYLIDNRVEDAPQKVTNRHASIRSGLSRRSRFRRF